MPMILHCAKCTNLLKISPGYRSAAGTCPKCKTELNLISAVLNTDLLEEFDHPVKNLLITHAERFAEYNARLQKLYKRVKRGTTHKDEFRLSQSVLKEEYFSPFVQDIVKIADFSFTFLERIALWDVVFGIFPYSKPESPPDVVQNIYQRYDLAGIVGLSYILKPLGDAAEETRILTLFLAKQESDRDLKNACKNILSSGESASVKERILQMKKDHAVLESADTFEHYQKIKLIYEDWGYGFNWVFLCI